MNLENLNLVELNAQEKQEIDGGFIHIGPHPHGGLHLVVDIFHGIWNGIVGRE